MLQILNEIEIFVSMKKKPDPFVWKNLEIKRRIIDCTDNFIGYPLLSWSFNRWNLSNHQNNQTTTKTLFMYVVYYVCMFLWYLLLFVIIFTVCIFWLIRLNRIFIIVISSWSYLRSSNKMEKKEWTNKRLIFFSSIFIHLKQKNRFDDQIIIIVNQSMYF